VITRKRLLWPSVATTGGSSVTSATKDPGTNVNQ
jgi:hypothetical protein